jgi:ankyrin repeat protein
MNELPARPNLGHLKKQAKDLLRLYGSHDQAAIARLRETLPAAAGRDGAQIVALTLTLRDAQSCVAREYGFASWTDLKSYVTAQAASGEKREACILRWLRLIYAGDIAGGSDRARPVVAARMLAADPGLAAGDPYVACAVGAEDVLRAATQSDPGWVNRAGGPLRLPPLVAVTHSSLMRLEAFRDHLYGSARHLLDAGADPNQATGSRWPPASLSKPSDLFPLSALYGAAGQNHDPEVTALLLGAGADPNDGESLYHGLENLACTRLLLEAGARIEGSNAMYRVLDLDSIAALDLLLAHGADPNEPARSAPTNEWGSPLAWAIRRRRSPAHIEALLRAGADARARTPDGASAYRLALRFGLPEVADLLRRAGGAEELASEEEFIAACARGDELAARRVMAVRPDLPGSLPDRQLRLLPDLTAEGCGTAVQLMVRLGWPIAVRGGDWSASALNHAVFRGDAALARFLLEHGASWTERHGFGADVCGTLGWASCNEPIEGGDWLGCAQALVAHGMPGAEPDAEAPDCVCVDGHTQRFSDEVTEFLLGADKAR